MCAVDNSFQCFGRIVKGITGGDLWPNAVLFDKIHHCFIAVAVARADTVQVGVLDDQRKDGDAHLDAGHIADDYDVPTVTDRGQ